MISFEHLSVFVVNFEHLIDCGAGKKFMYVFNHKDIRSMCKTSSKCFCAIISNFEKISYILQCRKLMVYESFS